MGSDQQNVSKKLQTSLAQHKEIITQETTKVIRIAEKILEGLLTASMAFPWRQRKWA